MKTKNKESSWAEEILEPIVKELVRKECVSGRLSADAKKLIALLQPQTALLFLYYFLATPQMFYEGTPNEVEPFPDGAEVIVGRGSLIDAVEYKHPLPREQK